MRRQPHARVEHARLLLLALLLVRALEAAAQRRRHHNHRRRRVRQQRRNRVQMQLQRPQDGGGVQQELRKLLAHLRDGARQQEGAHPPCSLALEQEPAASDGRAVQPHLQHADPLGQQRLVLCVRERLDDEMAAEPQRAHAHVVHLVERGERRERRGARRGGGRSRVVIGGRSPGSHRTERHAHDPEQKLEVQPVHEVAVAQKVHVLRPHLARNLLGHGHRERGVAAEPGMLDVLCPRRRARLAVPALRLRPGLGLGHRLVARAVPPLATRDRLRRALPALRVRRYLLVEEHVGRVRLHLRALDRLVGVDVPRDDGLHAAEAVLANLTRVEGLDERVVEVQPRVGAGLSGASLADEGVVVPRVGGAGVYQHARELVHAVAVLLVGRGRALRLAEQLLLPLEVADRVRRHVDRGRELAVVVQLHLLHQVKVKLEAFEVQDKHGRQPRDAAALGGLDVLALKVVLVVPVERLALDKLRQPVHHGRLVLDLDRDDEEGLHPLREAPPGLVDDLVDDGAAEEGLQQLGRARPPEPRLELLEEHVEELVDVHLDRRVERQVLAVAKGAAKVARVVPALLRLVQVAKHGLQVVEHVAAARLVRRAQVGRRVGRRGGGGRLDLERQDGCAELGDEEELLHERVEVAGRAQVLEADVAAARLLVHRRRVVPHVRDARVARARQLLREEHLEEERQIGGLALGELGEERERRGAAARGLALRRRQRADAARLLHRRQPEEVVEDGDHEVRPAVSAARIHRLPLEVGLRAEQHPHQPQVTDQLMVDQLGRVAPLHHGVRLLQLQQPRKQRGSGQVGQAARGAPANERPEQLEELLRTGCLRPRRGQ